MTGVLTMKNNAVKHMTIAALLIAMGIIIPMVMPKIMVPPASFTLASHVPVMIAMFFSPLVAVAVALGTTIGFLISTSPIIALRALSHVVFVLVGAIYLSKKRDVVLKNGQFTFFNWRFQAFNLVLALIHSALEVAVVVAFNFIGNVPNTTYASGYMFTIFVIMGIGGVIHSLVDFNIAYFVAGVLYKQFDIPVFTAAKKAYRDRQKKKTEMTA
jgi:niacin transporter